MRALQNMLSKTWHSAALLQTISMSCASGRLPLPLGTRRRACNVPGAALFDFGDVELEQVVQPGDEFLSAWVVVSVRVGNMMCPCVA